MGENPTKEHVKIWLERERRYRYHIGIGTPDAAPKPILKPDGSQALGWDGRPRMRNPPVYRRQDAEFANRLRWKKLQIPNEDKNGKPIPDHILQKVALEARTHYIEMLDGEE